MSGEHDTGEDRHSLSIELRQGSVSVSYLSSLLRLVQAALREVALSGDGTRERFDRQPQPILVLSRLSSQDGLTLQMTFVDPIDGTPLEELSSRTFDAFLDSLGRFVMSLPQPGLWGGAARRSPQPPFESGLSERMDQVYAELRRSSKVTLRFQTRSIEIEGDRMEIA